MKPKYYFQYALLAAIFVATIVSFIPRKLLIGWLPFSILFYIVGIASLFLGLKILIESFVFVKFYDNPFWLTIRGVLLSNLAVFIFLLFIGHIITIGYRLSLVSGAFNLIPELILFWLWTFSLIGFSFVINTFVLRKILKSKNVDLYKFVWFGDCIIFSVPILIYFITHPAYLSGIWLPCLYILLVAQNTYLAYRNQKKLLTE